MTRNTDYHIDLKVVVSPNGFTRHQATLTLIPHLDNNNPIEIAFKRSFESSEEAIAWAEKLDLMLAYGSVIVSSIYQL